MSIKVFMVLYIYNFLNRWRGKTCSFKKEIGQEEEKQKEERKRERKKMAVI